MDTRRYTKHDSYPVQEMLGGFLHILIQGAQPTISAKNFWSKEVRGSQQQAALVYIEYRPFFFLLMLLSYFDATTLCTLRSNINQVFESTA